MKISVIIPVYNSERIVRKLVVEVKKALKKKKYEIFLVNDFSTDSSWKIITKLSKISNKVKGISLKNNYGQHNAIMAGLKYAKGDYVIIMDDDLQHHPKYILKLINKIQLGFDLCYTNYVDRQHSYYKILLSQISNIVSSLIINKPLKLYLSSFKCMNLSLKNKLIKIKDPKIYIDGYLIKFTKKIASININHNKRYFGKSNYNLKKLFSLWIDLTLISKIHPFRSISILILLVKLAVFPFICYRLLFKKNQDIQYKISEKTF